MSIRWIGAVAWVGSVALVWAVLAPCGFRWSPFLSLSVFGLLTLWYAHWAGMRPVPSIAKLLDDSDSDWRVCHKRLLRPYAEHV